ncbi:MAG: DUF3021 domain-containing protein [Clostridia bacterium]|nr:DUF3021 domain-containing protein [Clostridia bacterium]MBR6810591.1 DUF3021 domain-containing protein [Clostridia bacterium]
MKKFLKDFVKQGLVAAWGGPVILAIIYLILGKTSAVETLTVQEVSLGILSSAIMGFIAAGIPVVYRQEALPLATAILIHAAVLYLDYLIVYLMNGWLKNDAGPILVFTAIFFAGFALIWLIIWQVTKRQVKQVNSKIQPE